MNPEELRIGNYIKGISNLAETVELVCAEEICTDRHDALQLNQIEPIPLTEEWLLDLGFEKWIWCDDCVFIPLFFGDSLYCRFYNNEWHIKRMKVGRDKRGVFGKTEGKYVLPKGKIKYVHQLQNLYYALTANELKLNNLDSEFKQIAFEEKMHQAQEQIQYEKEQSK